VTILSKFSSSYRRLARALDYHVGAKIRWRWLSRSLHPYLSVDGVRVLDAGSGNGDHTFRLARRYPTATFHGVELDASHIVRCQGRLEQEGLTNLTFSRGNLLDPLGDEDYDLAYNVDVLEHIDDDVAVLENITRALRSGGTLFVHTPLTPQRHWMRRFDLDRAKRGDHHREGYGFDELKLKALSVGLERVEMQFTHGRWGTLAWELWSLLRWRPIAKVLLWPLAMFLVVLETQVPHTRGNCVLMEATKAQRQ